MRMRLGFLELGVGVGVVRSRREDGLELYFFNCFCVRGWMSVDR